MRILLRNLLTRFYYGADHEWTEGRNLARVFPTTADALKFVQQEQLENVEIVLTFGTPDYDLCITVGRASPKRKEPPSLDRPSC